MLENYPPDLREFVAGKIASGEFKSVDEFEVVAARVYREMDQRYQEIKQSVADGIADIEAGNFVELKNEDELRQYAEDVKRRGRERLRNQASNP